MPKGIWDSGPAKGKDKQKYTKKGDLRPSYMLSESGEVVRRPRKGAKGKRDLGTVKIASDDWMGEPKEVPRMRRRMKSKKYTLKQAIIDGHSKGLPPGFSQGDLDDMKQEYRDEGIEGIPPPHGEPSLWGASWGAGFEDYGQRPLYKALRAKYGESSKDDMGALEAKRKRMEKSAFPKKGAYGKLPVSSIKAMRDFRAEYSQKRKEPGGPKFKGMMGGEEIHPETHWYKLYDDNKITMRERDEGVEKYVNYITHQQAIARNIPTRGPSLMGFGEVGSYNVYGGRSNLPSIMEESPASLPGLPGTEYRGGGGPAEGGGGGGGAKAKPKPKPKGQKKKGPNYQKGYASGYALGGAKASTFNTELEALAQHYMNPGKAHAITKTTLRGKVKYQLRKGKVLKQAETEVGRKRNESTVFL